MDGDTLPREVGSISLRDPTRARTACFVLLVGLTLVAFWTPLSMLIRLSFRKEEYSHILLLPLVSAALLVLERRRIFAHVETRWAAGSGLCVRRRPHLRARAKARRRREPERPTRHRDILGSHYLGRLLRSVLRPPSFSRGSLSHIVPISDGAHP